MATTALRTTTSVTTTTANDEPKINLEQFAQVLKTLREHYGLSMNELSRLSGVGLHTLSRMEKGEIPKPGIDDLAKLALFFGLDLNKMGAVLGLWSVPEQEEDVLAPALYQVTHEIRELGRRLPDTQQEELADIIETAVTLWRLRQTQAPAEETERDERLPAWLRPAKRRGFLQASVFPAAAAR